MRPRDNNVKGVTGAHTVTLERILVRQNLPRVDHAEADAVNGGLGTLDFVLEI
jgi:hypothetical protein